MRAGLTTKKNKNMRFEVVMGRLSEILLRHLQVSLQYLVPTRQRAVSQKRLGLIGPSRLMTGGHVFFTTVTSPSHRPESP